jgi:hypothetical protein
MLPIHSSVIMLEGHLLINAGICSTRERKNNYICKCAQNSEPTSLFLIVAICVFFPIRILYVQAVNFLYYYNET